MTLRVIKWLIHVDMMVIQCIVWISLYCLYKQCFSARECGVLYSETESHERRYDEWNEEVASLWLYNSMPNNLCLHDNRS